MTKIKKFIFVSFFYLSQAIVSEPTNNEIMASQNFSEKLSQPICSEYKLSGSLEEANVLGMLLTLGATTVGTFECAFYVGYEGTYRDDCNELLCRAKNQEVIINNAQHVISMSNNYLNDKNSTTSLKRKAQQGLRKINEAINNWKKVSASTTLNTNNVTFIEKNLNVPLEKLIINQFEIIPIWIKRDYFKKEADKERQRIAAEKERQRTLVEKEGQRIKDEKAKKELIDKLNQSISDYEKKYLDKLSKYQSRFKEITQIIETEEKNLIELKSRHPKVETIVSSRQIGDSNQKIIEELKKLLVELNDLN
jgi:hypothetical protein